MGSLLTCVGSSSTVVPQPEAAVHVGILLRGSADKPDIVVQSANVRIGEAEVLGTTQTGIFVRLRGRATGGRLCRYRHAAATPFSATYYKSRFFCRFAHGSPIAETYHNTVATKFWTTQRHEPQIRVVMPELDHQRNVFQLWHDREALGDNVAKLADAHVSPTSPVKELQLRLLPNLRVSTAVNPF
ncbi:hypothetical protein KUV51_03100 [Tateyamaria omphalii]|nr:hypothetical protein [Tateyamaria omphalii]MBY5931977.1 hypothetical protein [Tateyamaria omphalii]